MKTGDRVFLARTTGPTMLVERVHNDGNVSVVYVDKEDRIRKEILPVELLRPEHPPGPGPMPLIVPGR
jgi:hypothetical protein